MTWNGRFDGCGDYGCMVCDGFHRRTYPLIWVFLGLWSLAVGWTIGIWLAHLLLKPSELGRGACKIFSGEIWLLDSMSFRL
jgi:hypothetical protein